MQEGKPQEKRRRRIALRSDEKRCHDCGRIHKTGKATCPTCIKKAADRKKNRIKAGFCWKCGEGRPKEGATRCTKCLRAAKKTSQKSSIRLRAEGKCLRCGKESDRKADGTFYAYCDDCRERKRMDNATIYSTKAARAKKNRYQRLHRKGLCVICGSNEAYEKDGKTYTRCKECIDKIHSGMGEDMTVWWTENSYIQQAERWLEDCLKEKMKYLDDLDYSEFRIKSNERKNYDVTIDFIVGEEEFTDKQVKVTVPVLSREAMRVASERAIERVRA